MIIRQDDLGFAWAVLEHDEKARDANCTRAPTIHHPEARIFFQNSSSGRVAVKRGLSGEPMTCRRSRLRIRKSPISQTARSQSGQVARPYGISVAPSSKRKHTQKMA